MISIIISQTYTKRAFCSTQMLKQFLIKMLLRRIFIIYKEQFLIKMFR